MLFIPASNPQHGDAGEDAYAVWQLIDDIEAERDAEYTGRHRLRAPPSEADEPPRAACPPTGSARRLSPITAPILPVAGHLPPTPPGYRAPQCS
ncbi:hypothetical protein [Saccharopolyspora pogona]|uniref:hypothetical protein n=1 Tax=Saccharopolyspora pogona TaxID=333966 RepID=UPI001683299B|nr:hypothetical protein [Saccharopolyspora pogona]